LGAKKIAIQLPIVVKRKLDLKLDNKPIECTYLGNKTLNLGQNIEVYDKQQKLFHVSTEGSVGLRYPNLKLSTYGDNEIDTFEKDAFYIAILSKQFDQPQHNFKGSWIIELP